MSCRAFPNSLQIGQHWTSLASIHNPKLQDAHESVSNHLPAFRSQKRLAPFKLRNNDPDLPSSWHAEGISLQSVLFCFLPDSVVLQPSDVSKMPNAGSRVKREISPQSCLNSRLGPSGEGERDPASPQLPALSPPQGRERVRRAENYGEWRKRSLSSQRPHIQGIARFLETWAGSKKPGTAPVWQTSARIAALGLERWLIG